LAGPIAQAAEKAQPAVIAVVDFQNVLRQAVASKRVTEQIEKQRVVFQDEIQKLETQLRAQEEELKQQRAVLAPEAFNQRARDWQERAAAAQQQVQIRKRQLDEAFNEAMVKVRQALLQVTKEIASEVGANLVLPLSEIVFVDDKLDMSKEALARLDKRLTTVAVKIPPPAGARAPAPAAAPTAPAARTPPAPAARTPAPGAKTN
jgi:Skp family chaperone for outer membrane proteins